MAGILGKSRRIALISLAAFGVAVTPATADDDNDPLCYTTQSVLDPPFSGPSASIIYDNRFTNPVKIPAGLLDNGYVPQGMAAWPNWDGTTEDILLIGAYDSRSATGASGIWGVVTSGPRTGDALGRMLIASGHVGGLGVYGGWLYVGSEAEIRGYRLGTVREALQGANTNVIEPREYNRPTSYTVGFMGTGDGHLWAGDFDENTATHLNGYQQVNASTGAIEFRSATQAYAPKKTQGVAVTANEVIFSTSWTRQDRGNIWVMRRGQDNLTDANSYCFRAPSMNQGVAIMNGQLYVNFESGAAPYVNDPDTRNKISRVHAASFASIAALPTSGAED